MDATDTFLQIATARARERLLKRNASAVERLDAVFRRQVTVFGYSAHRLLDALAVPHRSYVSKLYLPARVLVVEPDSDAGNHPSADVIVDLLARGGTAIIVGRGLSTLDEQNRVVRIAAPLLPKNVPEKPADEDTSAQAAYKRAVDRWAKKYCDIAAAIAEAM